MAKELDKNSFGKLGKTYQQQLIKLLLTDKHFAESIMDIMSPSYFDETNLKYFAQIAKEAYTEGDVILSIESLKIRISSKNLKEIALKPKLKVLDHLKKLPLEDVDFVKESAFKFCKQQNLISALRNIDKILQRGDIDEYDLAEQLIKEALQKGDNKDDAIDVGDDIDNVLKEDYRNPIPTGISGLDEIMNGGLAKGELGIILAALGVGKTTIITKIANHAKNIGYNVLQIFFEDLPKQIQRKHFACWTGINISDLAEPENVDFVKNTVIEKNEEGGAIKLKKMSSESTTIPKIKKYVKSLINNGFPVDLILIDYIDVVQPSRRYDDNNVAEGSTMREFENMLYELDIAGWTAIQGNRSSINTEFVETDQMGGSIKKAQIGHFIMSIAKSLEQRENKTANIAILKSRFGDDGRTYEDAIFDNGTVHIDMSKSGGKTLFNVQQDKAKAKDKGLKELLKNMNEKEKSKRYDNT